ncbi:MAG: HAMP domain-containing sensor histidine kinase [Methanoregulaceae archaeon]
MKEDCDTAVAEANQKSATYALVVDLLGKITGLKDEEAFIAQMLDLFMVLFSPERTGFLPLYGGSPGPVISKPDGAYPGMDVRDQFLACQDNYLVTGDGKGFFLQVRYDADLLGIVHIDGVSFPERIAEYLTICHFVAQVAGLSLANARTYQELTDTLGERDTESTERKRAEGALLLAKKKITLLGNITRHDIQNQLMVILGNIALARVDVTDPAMEEPLREIETATKTIRSQLDFGRVYQEIGSHGSQWQQIAEIISLADVPKGITLETDLRDVSVYADPMLPKVFFNLLDNSVKHGEHTTRIRVSQEQRQNGMIITWEDDGTGIPAGEKEWIFEHGVGKDTGLGLFVIHEILAITGITIRETGEPGKGARFELLVPAGAYRCDHLPK